MKEIILFNPILDNFTSVFDAGFKSKSGGNTTPTIVKIPESKNKVIKIYLNREIDAINTTNERTELVPHNLPEKYFTGGKCAMLGIYYSYAFNIFFPLDWKIDKYPEIIAQWHGVADDETETRIGPPLSLKIDKGKFWLGNRSISKPISEYDAFGKVILDYQHTHCLGPVVPGQWVKFKFLVRWSYDAPGIVKVYKDNVNLLQFFSPNTSNDKLGTVFSFGPYKWDWPKGRLDGIVEEETLYFSNVKISVWI